MAFEGVQLPSESGDARRREQEKRSAARAQEHMQRVGTNPNAVRWLKDRLEGAKKELGTGFEPKSSFTPEPPTQH